MLPPTGRYNPPYHPEVVGAELDEPLGHIWMLDIVPSPSLITRDGGAEKVQEAIMRFVRPGSPPLHCDFVPLQAEEN